jgi:hypothetical protein
VKETACFVNEGFGWECKSCREVVGAAARDVEESPSSALGRFFLEGEAEGGGPRLTSSALARWKDESRTTLRCPVCGVEEEFEG